MSRFRAIPYAKALYEVASASDPATVEPLRGELEAVATALETVPDFHRVLTTPVISPDRKTAILDQVLDALGVGDLTRRFLHVVQRHYRMQHMRHIAEAYRDILDRAQGRRRATVEVAGPIDAAQRDAILSAVGEVLDCDVIADFKDNSELLAGFRVQVGSKVFDGSLAGQVDRLSRQLMTE